MIIILKVNTLFSQVTVWESGGVPSLFALPSCPIPFFSVALCVCWWELLAVIPIVGEQETAKILLGLLSSFISFCISPDSQQCKRRP